MPHSYGKRARTRQKFSKDFRKKGLPSVGKSLTTFKVGDYVDIVVDPSVHRGMPYHFYHGRTGVVYNVSKRALGIEIKKVVGHRQILKRINARTEHVRKSKCKEDFKRRAAENRKAAAEAKAQGVPHVTIKRVPVGPRSGELVTTPEEGVKTLAPQPFVENYF
eukprot:Polyplicarium_translucidae@DN2454_c0_g1_i1.p6